MDFKGWGGANGSKTMVFEAVGRATAKNCTFWPKTAVFIKTVDFKGCGCG